MDNPLINFLKKTYKILIVIFAAIIFFLGYNVYLVDRSLVNLRFTLDKIDDVKDSEDAKKLATILDYSLLSEVASPELQTSNLSRIELAKDILSEHKDKSKLEDVKFALKEAIEQKEKQRPAVLAALDKVGQILVPISRKPANAKLERRIRYLKGRLNTIEDRDEMQEVYYEIANTYTQLSEFTKAKEAYRKAIDLNPETKLAKKSRFNLAWNEKLRGNLDEAIKEFEAISQTYTHEEMGIFSQYQVADALRKKGDYEKAAAVYEQVAKQQPHSDLAQIALLQAGSTQLFDLKDYEKAKEIFEKSEKLFKGSDMAAHIEKTSLPSIVAQYRKRGFNLLDEGYNLSLSGKYKEALKYFDKALEIDPADGVSYTGKALSFLWLKEPNKALELAKKAVELEPYNETVSVNLGYIYIQLGLIDEAITEYKRLTSFNAFTAWGYYNLGAAYIIQNKLEEAASAFYQATKIDPKFTVALNNLSCCLWQLKKYAESIKTFEKAITVDNQFLDALYNLGVIYATTGRYADARKKFERVLEIKPEYVEARTYLEEIKKLTR